MIADYMYNTPALAADATGVMLLMTSAYTDVAALNAQVVGKTAVELKAMVSVLGVAATGSIKSFGFYALRDRGSAYRNSAYLANFSFPETATFDVIRDGKAKGFVYAMLSGGVVVRAVATSIAISGIETVANRVSLSVDDVARAFISTIEAPKLLGMMLGNALDTLQAPAPTSSAVAVSGSVFKTLRADNALLSAQATGVGPLATSTLRAPAPTASAVATMPDVRKELRAPAPTK